MNQLQAMGQMGQMGQMGGLRSEQRPKGFETLAFNSKTWTPANSSWNPNMFVQVRTSMMQWCHRDIENMICDPKPPRWIIFCGVRHQKIRLGNRPDKSPFAKTQWIRRFVNFWCLRSISCNIYRINQYIHVHTIWYYMVVPCKAGDVPGNKAVVVVVVGFSFCFFLWVLAECVRMSARGKGAFCGLRVVDYLNFFLMLCPLESSFLDAFLAPVPINDHQWALKPPQKLLPKPPETKGGISNYQPFPKEFLVGALNAT